MNLIIFGPPGAGKGTQSNNIVNDFDLKQVSTGDLLRNEIKLQTDLGKKIKSIIDYGVGDGNQLKLFNTEKLIYTGIDVSEIIFNW